MGRSEKGRIVRFDSDSWKDAKALDDAQIDDPPAGREAKIKNLDQLNDHVYDDDTVRVMDVCNQFLTYQAQKLEVGKIGDADVFSPSRGCVILGLTTIVLLVMSSRACMGEIGVENSM